MIIELVWSASGDEATLRCFSLSPDGGMWSHKSLGAPMGWMSLWADSVLSHMGMKEITFGLVLRYVKSLCSFDSLSL